VTVGLNPRNTFETFVKGASNQFALAAALRVAETPARSYNPLFIYGAAGLGKTHLLHAIGHYVNQNYAHYLVRYVSTETFLNEYIDGIRTNSMAMFKRRYRDVDVLLIDDIQFMEGKEGLQEEFFHRCNSLHGANKQIVISSDRMPDAMPTLEDRLRGRFKWGLITDIQPPDLETRLAILRNKAEREGTPVSAEVLEFIATHITNNIRELEGALIRVGAYASLNRVPVTAALAERLLEDIVGGHRPKQLTPEAMLETISSHLGFSVEALKGKSRQRPLVTARQIAMYVFREQTDLSFPAIARVFGNRDHTTVIHAVDKVQRMMKERQQVYDQVTDLIQALKGNP
jgi:chromosomal replication initiator protein